MSDGTEDNAVRGLSALLLCRIRQVESVNTNYPACKHQVRVKWSKENRAEFPCFGDSASRVISNPHGRRKWWRYGEALWNRLSPPPWPWPDPGLSQDCCPLYHASPCWLWRGDCRYNADCSRCVFKDQNNNGICSAHSLTLIYHSFPVPLITSTTQLIVSDTRQKSKSCSFLELLLKKRNQGLKL